MVGSRPHRRRGIAYFLTTTKPGFPLKCQSGWSAFVQTARLQLPPLGFGVFGFVRFAVVGFQDRRAISVGLGTCLTCPQASQR
jgi:hypothetical protein